MDKLDLKDDVLCRANGFYTYFAADIAYHRNKFEKRGFDKVHQRLGRRPPRPCGPAAGRSGRSGAGRLPPAGHRADAAGQPAPGRQARPHVQAHRQGHRPARICWTRSAWTPPASSSIPALHQPLDFDLGLAVREDSENPVYYVQYAHARICTLLNRVGEEGWTSRRRRGGSRRSGEGGGGAGQVPVHIRTRSAGRPGLRPSRVNRYLVSLAGDFHRFTMNAAFWARRRRCSGPA